MGEEQKERERERERERLGIPSRLPSVRAESDTGLKLRNLKILT